MTSFKTRLPVASCIAVLTLGTATAQARHVSISPFTRMYMSTEAAGLALFLSTVVYKQASFVGVASHHLLAIGLLLGLSVFVCYHWLPLTHQSSFTPYLLTQLTLLADALYRTMRIHSPLSHRLHVFTRVGGR